MTQRCLKDKGGEKPPQKMEPLEKALRLGELPNISGHDGIPGNRKSGQVKRPPVGLTLLSQTAATTTLGPVRSPRHVVWKETHQEASCIRFSTCCPGCTKRMHRRQCVGTERALPQTGEEREVKRLVWLSPL